MPEPRPCKCRPTCLLAPSLPRTTTTTTVTFWLKSHPRQVLFSRAIDVPNQYFSFAQPVPTVLEREEARCERKARRGAGRTEEDDQHTLESACEELASGVLLPNHKRPSRRWARATWRCILNFQDEDEEDEELQPSLPSRRQRHPSHGSCTGPSDRSSSTGHRGARSSRVIAFHCIAHLVW